MLSCCSSVLGSLRILVLHVFDANEPTIPLKPQSSGQFHMEWKRVSWKTVAYEAGKSGHCGVGIAYRLPDD